METYKFVPLAKAPLVEAGRLRIGTLRGFGDLKGIRQDPREAKVSYSHPEDNFIRGTDPKFQRLVEIGSFAFEPGADLSGLILENCSFEPTLPNTYCFCMSRSMKARPAKPTAAFLVRDVGALAKTLSRKYADVLGSSFDAGSVTYKPIDLRLSGPHQQPSAFIKAPDFAWEEEYRIVWRDPPSDDPNTLPIFDLPDDDEEVASLLLRLD